MRLGILNGEQGIAVIDSLDDLDYIQIKQLEKQMPDGATINDLAFFYMADRDWIVINKGHALYEFYSEIIPMYLSLPDEGRRECRAVAPSDEVKEGYNILEGVINRRFWLYQKGGASV